MKSFIVTFVFTFIVLQFESYGQDILPLARSWSGKSESLIVPKDDSWITPAELNDFIYTPDYKATMKWLIKLCDASDLLSFKTIGTSGQNRPILMIIASKESDLHQGENINWKKPNVLVQAGIHSGEIDGKDAGLMLLRDIAFGGKDNLLDNINLLFVPILSVDGHEQAGPYNRPNQRGPENMGWRTNAKNLNLNRDYTKLDTEGVRAIVNVMNVYDPIFYIDIHVTDGADYPYDITYGYRKSNGFSSNISTWLADHYQQDIDRTLESFGHIPGPLIFTYKTDDFSNGIIDYYLPLRFSDAYGDARHIPSILVENHSLKPYKQRVLGTYIYLEKSLDIIDNKLESLKKVIAQDRATRPDSIALSYVFNDEQNDSIRLKLFKAEKGFSDVTNRNYTIWTQEIAEQKVPIIRMDKGVKRTKVPRAYWVPAQWSEIISLLIQHGINVEIIKTERRVSLHQYYLEDYKINPVPSEGRFRFKEINMQLVEKEIFLPPGSARISTDQHLGKLLVLLMEPNAPDSFFQWGFFHTILSRTEYIERYVMEPLILKMMKEDESIKVEFEKKIEKDPSFANDTNAIFRWFYSKTPYFDKNWKLIPIGIEY